MRVRHLVKIHSDETLSAVQHMFVTGLSRRTYASNEGLKDYESGPFFLSHLNNFWSLLHCD